MVNGPAGTALTEVIVVSGSFKVARASHDWAADARDGVNTSAGTAATKTAKIH
jgi:hypothetical protein